MAGQEYHLWIHRVSTTAYMMLGFPETFYAVTVTRVKNEFSYININSYESNERLKHFFQVSVELMHETVRNGIPSK